MKVSINTTRIKKRDVEALGTAIGKILANDCIIISKTKKNRDVYLEFALNPFVKSKRTTIEKEPTDSCKKKVSKWFRCQETTNKNVIRALTIGISDAANARKITGEVFYMTEVERILSKVQRTMLDYNIDSEHLFRLKY